MIYYRHVNVFLLDCLFISGWFDEILVYIVIHFSLYMWFAYYTTPQDIKSIGLHEKTGDCKSVSPVNTATGKVRNKKFIKGDFDTIKKVSILTI